MGMPITTTSGSIPAIFNGSATVTSVQTGTSSPGSIVATSQEFDLGATSYKAYAFNGVSGGATKAYMPSAFCNYFDPPATSGIITSYYALTNASDANIDITVTYSSGVSQTFPGVTPGNKVSPNGCATASAGANAANPGPNANGYSGSATVTAAWSGTPGTGNPSVVAMGKIVGLGYSTAFEGVPDPAPESVALPYVRFQASSSSTWLDGSRQQVYIAVQNVGSTQLAAGSISVKFYDNNGVQVGTTQTNAAAVGVNSKVGFNAGSVSSNFGYWASGAGGGAIITGPAGSHLAVLARAQTWDASSGFKWSEDYIGIPIQ